MPDFRQHRTVTAVYGGVCVATGRRYPKGTPLVRTPKGYAIAPSTLTGNVPPELPQNCPPDAPQSRHTNEGGKTD